MRKFMKKLIVVFSILCMLVGCSGDKSDETDNSIDKTEEKGETSKNYDSHLAMLIEPAFLYADHYNMTYYDFDERESLMDFMSMDTYGKYLDNAYYVEIKYLNDMNDQVAAQGYHKSASQTEYLYYGEFDENNDPTGTGIIYKIWDALETEETITTVIYAGDFLNGFYEGYGVSFMPVVGDYGYAYDADYFEENMYFINGGNFTEAYFKQGKEINKINKFETNLSESIYWPYEEGANPDINDISYSLTSYNYHTDTGIWDYNLYWRGVPQYEAQLKDNKLYGYGKRYVEYSDILLYEGNFENDKYNGYGKLYSKDTGNLIYDGEFVDGRYHGSGKLYDESGRLIHEGEFVCGEIK